MQRSRLVLCVTATALAALAAPVADALAAAGGGSSGFGGGGGGGGGGGSGFGGGGSGSGGWDPIFIVIMAGLVVIALAVGPLSALRMRRKRRNRAARVRLAAAEAAEDDAYLGFDQVVKDAAALFTEVQAAWDARDRRSLRKLVGKDLMVEWKRRLDDFDAKGWHNRVNILAGPKVVYVGLLNRDDDTDDRVVVRLEAELEDYVESGDGKVVTKKGEAGKTTTLTEYWTLARTKDGRGWLVASIEQDEEGAHQLDEKIVASPWSDEERLRDEAVIEQAAGDKLPDGYKPADVAEVDFSGDARARALDLSLADGRFAPDVLEAAARRAVEAWAEAVDGEDGPLEAVARPEVVRLLLYPGAGANGKTRLVVRGPRVRRIAIAGLDPNVDPATMTIEVEVGGRRYTEDRDTAAVVSGSKESATTFTERWTLALEGPDDIPWRIVEAGGR